MQSFAVTCDAVAAAPGKLAKIAILAGYFRRIGDADLSAAARFVSGDALGGNGRTPSIGGRTIVSAAARVWGIGDDELRRAYRATGDLGDALARFAREPHDLGLFRETLTPASLADLLAQAAAASGPSAGSLRRATCERILAACSTPGEARYAVKVITGDLRIGLREGFVLEAIALAFDQSADAVRRAATAAGDAGVVALAARCGTLASVTTAYGAPIGFMLASPIAYGADYPALRSGTWIVEDKYDGIRAQAHVWAWGVKLFSRGRGEIAASFPEIVAALAGLREGVILDGEIVASRDGAVLPFRYLQTRLQRKDPGAGLQRDVPALFVAFDLLADGPLFLLDEPLDRRRRRLGELVAPAAALALAPWAALEEGASAQRVAERFEAARSRGNEGLMLKRTDSAYTPGRRGKAWLKLKRELSTLDVVVVGVEWGHGKRKDVLSDYTFAVRDRPGGERLLTIGKAYSGLTDAEIAELTAWFLANQIGMLNRRALAVKPEIVLEIAFDVIQRSALHESGYALRFPRIARVRPDKDVREIDTLQEVERIYEAMIAREGVAR